MAVKVMQPARGMIGMKQTVYVARVALHKRVSARRSVRTYAMRRVYGDWFWCGESME